MAGLETLTPTSGIAQTLVKRVSRFVTGQPVNLVADLGLDSPTPAAQTTIGDTEQLQRMQRMLGIAKGASGTQEDQSRRARYMQYAEMVDRGPELAACLKVHCNFVFGGEVSAARNEMRPFEVVYSDTVDPRTKEAAERITMRVGLYSLVPAIYREGRRYGDSFTELVFSRVALVGQKALAPWDCEVVWDDYGRLMGYVVKPSANASSWMGAAGGKTLAPIQCLHYAPDRERGNRYGTSIFAPLRDAFRQFQNGIDIMFVMIILQAAHRRTIAQEVPTHWTDQTIGDWVKRLKGWNADASFIDAQGRFHASIAAMLELDDKVIPYRKGNAAPTFHNEPQSDPKPLRDVLEWMQDRFYVGTGTPKALAGNAKDTNSKATLETQGLHFMKTLRYGQKDAAMIALEILVRGLLVEEMPLADGDIMVRMPLLSEFNDRIVAETLKLRAEAAKILATDMQVPMRWVLEQVLKIPAHQVDDVLAQMGPLPALGAGDAVDDLVLTPEAAERVLAAMKEQAEQLREDIELLRPVTATLRDLVEQRAA